MTTDSDLHLDARRHGVELAARQPRLIHRIRLYWTGRRWGIKTAAGTPVAFADTAQALRDFARARYWERPKGLLLEELPARAI